jgi:signal transduction histidine kinase
MARSPSEAGIFSAPAPLVPAPGPGPAVPPPGGGELTWLPGAAIALAVLSVAAFAVQAAGAGHGRVFAAVGALAALLLAVVLYVMHRQHGAAIVLWEQRAQQAQQHAAEQQQHAAEQQRYAAEQQRYAAEQQQHAALWEQRAGQAQVRAEELGLRAGEQGDRSRTIMAGVEEAADYLLHVQLPAALEGSVTAPAFLADGSAANGEAAAIFTRVGTAVYEGVAKLREQVAELRKQSDDHSESSRRAVLTLARLLQASALRIQAQAAKMAEDHPADPAVLEASMRVEHASAQMARNAQSLVVLCGEWPGQQWPDPLALPDVVRAAAGRIMSYQRVNVSGDHGIAADAGVVEPLIHLTAELLANATQSSPPATQVEVTVQAVQHGAVIEIDDRGIGMEEAQFKQARAVLSGNRLINLGELGEFPQTGLAVIGHYVNRHGIGVELRRSPYGGVRAIVLVPDSLVVNNLDPAAAAPPAASAPLPLSATAPADDPGFSETVHGRRLPRRHSLRGHAQPGSPASQPTGWSAALPATPEEEGAFLAAYLGAGETAAGQSTGTAQEAEDDTAFSDETER